MTVSVSVRRIALMMAMAVLVLIGLANPLPAADDARFTFAGTVKFVENVPKYHVFAWEGRADHLGPCAGMALVWSRGLHRQAWVTLENDRGDSIDFFMDWTSDRDTGVGIGTYEITGGAGRFAGATGSGSMHVMPFPGGADIILDGTISD
ncbi:MAG TPA: hypothetical protein VKD72_39775 [Gemmataceae bacterium]|nr:hypothetical protein [Gemmataceae bacterium]